MKSLYIFVFMALAEGIGSVALGAAPTPGTLLTNDLIRIAASNSLVTFRRHITLSNYELMGFNTANEILMATNGEPLLSFTVPFTQLTNYQTGDFNILLQPSAPTQLKFHLIVPIMVGTNVRSSLTLRPEQGQATAQTPMHWREGDWGHPKVIRNLIDTYRAIPPADIANMTVPFAVEIPIPRLWLIGYYTDQTTPRKMIFRATTDLRIGTNTINRSEMLTEAAMQQLTTEARRYNRALPN